MTEAEKERLLSHPVYRAMQRMTKYLDRYYLDPVLGVVLPSGVGDTLSSILSLPFIYFSLFVVKSVPLTLAVTVNILRDILLGMIPFFVGDVIDIFFRSYGRNMKLITGYITGDAKVEAEVKRKTVFSIVAIIVLLVLIILLFKLVLMLGAWMMDYLRSIF